ncbi:pyoverdine biosynthesis protein PvdE [Arenicella chitinivorans]|uniref:Pyoverdine biosynthesis protein PvdE n=2 Tax=Arenicella chitinivorans TaxID=1329800 RepID=A0A918RRW2_9GAMM|nr:pyoverdine biosynthesis protein PvdE [Arenicella chitinivorans]
MLALASALSIVSAGIGILILALLNGEIRSVSDQNGTTANALPLFLGLIALMVLLSVVSQYVLAKLSAGVVAKTRTMMVNRLLQASYLQTERLGGHRTYAALTSDTARINKGISVIPEYTYSLASVMIALGYIGYLSVPILLFVLTVISVAILTVSLLLSRATRILQRLRSNDDDLFEQYQMLVEGSKELNLNHQRKRFFYDQLFAPTAESARRNTVNSQVNFALITNISNAFVFCAMVGMLFGANAFLPSVTTEVLVGTMLVFIYMVGPLSFIIDSFSSLVDAKVGYDRVRQFEHALTIDDGGLEGPLESVIDAAWSTIEFKNVCFTYPQHNSDSGFSVGPINLVLQRGQTCFICGGNGSGKSTFAKLLCGLYAPSKGEILIDGVPLETHTQRQAYRNLFTTIFSDFYLFADILDDHGQPCQNQSEVDGLLHQMQMDHKVDVVEGRFSTTDLSQGQRKRLALIQSQLEAAPICLFDEWAADQDPYFRHQFYHHVLPLLRSQNKMVVAITHDEAYFDQCDRLFKFDLGVVAEVFPEHRQGLSFNQNSHDLKRSA